MFRVLFIGGGDLPLDIAGGLSDLDCSFDTAVGVADALRRVRRRSFDLVVTDPATSIEEDLAFVQELVRVRPGVKPILLAPRSTPEELISALHARVFACFTAPIHAQEVAEMVRRAAADDDWWSGVELVSAHPDWLSIRADCRRATAERLVHIFGELHAATLDAPGREELMLAFREILLNAVEHGAGFSPDKVVQVNAVRTRRAIVFYVRDPGPGFRRDALPHSALSNPPDDPTAHVAVREGQGVRPGGFGILLARNIVDELVYSEFGNEVVLVKYLDRPTQPEGRSD